MKTCPKCNTDYEATTENFYANKQRKDGLAGHCKKCHYACNNANRIKSKAKQAQYRKKAWLKDKNRVTNYINRLRRVYGLTSDQLQGMMNDQQGVCAICGDSLVYPESKITYAIDHCHTTGKVRGLLCNQCNIGIGNLRDSIPLLKSAITYLS